MNWTFKYLFVVEYQLREWTYIVLRCALLQLNKYLAEIGILVCDCMFGCRVGELSNDFGMDMFLVAYIHYIYMRRVWFVMWRLLWQKFVAYRFGWVWCCRRHEHAHICWTHICMYVYRNSVCGWCMYIISKWNNIHYILAISDGQSNILQFILHVSNIEKKQLLVKMFELDSNIFI